MPDAPDPAETEVLRRFLTERDVACPGCGYNLRGAAGEKCPECAAPIRLESFVDQAFAPGARLLAWALGLTALWTASDIGLWAWSWWRDQYATGAVNVSYMRGLRGMYAQSMTKDVVLGGLAVYALVCMIRFFRTHQKRLYSRGVCAAGAILMVQACWYLVRMVLNQVL